MENPAEKCNLKWSDQNSCFVLGKSRVQIAAHWTIW